MALPRGLTDPPVLKRYPRRDHRLMVVRIKVRHRDLLSHPKRQPRPLPCRARRMRKQRYPSDDQPRRDV